MPTIEELDKKITDLQQILSWKESVEQALEEIAIQFIKPANLDAAINFTLEKLLELSQCNRAVILQVNPEKRDLISMTHEKCRNGTPSVSRHVQNIPRNENKWFEKIYREQGYISIEDTSKMPEEAHNERALYKKNKIGAVLISPFTSNNEFRGNVHLEFLKPIDHWPAEIIRMIIFAAVLIEHTIERSEANMKLINEKERAEQSDRMKSAFMANLSHEIRTPLNGIMGFTKLMIRNRFNENKKLHYSRLIENSSMHLLSIIDDLIDMSRIESGSIKMIPTTVDVKTTILGVYESFAHSLLSGKNIQFKLDMPFHKDGLTIISDPRRIRQILDNLIKNAIRYTPEGAITLGYRIRKRKLNIYVTDTGIGIKKEDIPKVFNRFWQVDHAQARTYGGSGLGLSISKDFAKMLGGDIKVRSRIGKGSEFILELPLQ